MLNRIFSTLPDWLQDVVEIVVVCLMYGWPFIMAIGGEILIAHLLGAPM